MGKFSDLAERCGRAFASGDLVFRQGDIADCMYLVYSGSVGVYREGDGQRLMLDKLERGDLFGEMALVDGKPRSASVTALEDSVLIPVSSAFIRDNIHRDPGFIFQIIETLILRIESTADALSNRVAHGMTGIAKEIKGHETPGGNLLQFLKLFRGYAEPDKYLEFRQGEEIFHEGEAGDLMFIILEGTVSVVAAAGERTQVLARLTRGDVFGESALLTGRPRTATTVADTPVTVLPVVRRDLVEGLMNDPVGALELVRMLIVRLRKNLDLLTGV